MVLSEDGVDFYKKKTDRSPKGMIPLKGATLSSPCQDFVKRTVRKCCYMEKKRVGTLLTQKLLLSHWHIGDFCTLSDPTLQLYVVSHFVVELSWLLNASILQ